MVVWGRGADRSQNFLVAKDVEAEFNCVIQIISNLRHKMVMVLICNCCRFEIVNEKNDV